jgi:flagellar motor switch protein FliN/FliY
MDDSQNEKIQLSQQDADIIGEVSNISMGSAATALSNIMGKKVIITSPHVEVATVEAIDGIQRVPSLGVEISYTEGVVGKDILIIKQSDAVEIVKVMMGDDMAGEGFGEIQISAIAEVMNQMMGSSATALSNFLNKSVNISPPSAFIMTEENKEEKLGYLYQQAEQIILVRFLFKVEDVFESDLYIVMNKDFSKGLVDAMMENLNSVSDDTPPEESKEPDFPSEEQMPQYEPETPAVPPVSPQYSSPAPAPQPVNTVPSAASPIPTPQSAPQYAPQYAPAPAYYTQPQAAAAAVPMPQTRVRPAKLDNFDFPPTLQPAEKSNFELIEEVPLELSVEVGKARKMVKEVIDLTVGSIIELDKQAGDPVDIIVNGQLIAHGEVVVIDESFGVRITEIVDKNNKQR